MEKEKVIESYRHRFNGKKYIFFSPLGESEVAGEKNATSISKDTLIHDIKVSELARSFKEVKWVDSASLEHELQNKRDFKSIYKVVPDALLELVKNENKYQIAVELELTQKNKQRIKEKAKQYLISIKYDYVIYFFSKESVLKTYMEVIKSEVGEKNFGQFIFVLDREMTAKETNLLGLNALVNGKEISLEKVFVD